MACSEQNKAILTKWLVAYSIDNLPNLHHNSAFNSSSSSSYSFGDQLYNESNAF